MTGFNKDDIWKTDENCFICKEKGNVLVRLVSGWRIVQRSKNKINRCTNPNCFRYLKNVPKNWMIDNETEYEKTKREDRETDLRDHRKSKGRPNR